jgi:putative SOS response-associated peptidase YedK
MCGRYILVQKMDILENRFQVSADDGFLWEPSYNISPGQMAPVITDEKSRLLQLLLFGMTPFWAKKPMYLFNARAEGDRNPENDAAYGGQMGIVNKPAFRRSIRSRRCLVPADAFIEGTTVEKLEKPFVVHLADGKRPFTLAGLWDEWKNPETGEILRSFSIITTVANTLMQKIPHHRMPVILTPSQEKKWLNNEMELPHILSILRPYPAEEMNAYPISNLIKNPRENRRDLIEPLGEPFRATSRIEVKPDLRLMGMGRNSAKNNPLE